MRLGWYCLKQRRFMTDGKDTAKAFMQLKVKHIQNNWMRRTAVVMVHEVGKAIRKLKNDKSLGYDNTPAELIKMTGVNAVCMLQMICNGIWKSQHLLVEWKKSVLLPSLKDNALQCQNNRMIALITHASKMLLYITIDRIQQYLSREISDMQAGFWHGWGTHDHIASMRSVIQKINDRNQSIVLFIEYSKAFYCVEHE